MSFCSHLRSQQWRNEADAQLPTWKSSFDDTRSLVSEAESLRNTPNSKDTCPSPSPPHLSIGRRRHPQWSPPPLRDAERQPGLGLAFQLLPQHTMMKFQILIRILKLHIKKVENAVSARLVHHRSNVQYAGRVRDIFQSDSRHERHNAEFCTQRCLLGLQQGVSSMIPARMCCSINIAETVWHAIDPTTLVQRVKKQLDKNIDRTEIWKEWRLHGADMRAKHLSRRPKIEHLSEI